MQISSWQAEAQARLVQERSELARLEAIFGREIVAQRQAELRSAQEGTRGTRCNSDATGVSGSGALPDASRS